jgi:hypothetical protein
MRLGHIDQGTILGALQSEQRRQSIEHPEENAVCRRCAGEFVSTATSCGEDVK